MSNHNGGATLTSLKEERLKTTLFRINKPVFEMTCKSNSTRNFKTSLTDIKLENNKIANELQLNNSLFPKRLVQLIHFHCPVLKLLHPATVSWDLSQVLLRWQSAASVLH